MSIQRSMIGPWTMMTSPGNRRALSTFWRSPMTDVGMLGRGAASPSLVARLGSMLAVFAVTCELVVGIPRVHAEPTTATGQKSGLRPHREPERAVRAEARIEQRMNDPIAVTVRNLPLKDVLEYLDAVQGLKLRYELEGLPQEEARSVMDQPITLNLKDLPLRVVFDLLLEPVQFDWIIKEGAIVVTTRAKADEQLSDLKYDVSDLVAAGIPTNDLAAAIMATIASASWESKGGRGALKAETESLVVRQVRPRHGEVQRLMADIRRQLTETEIERRVREQLQTTKQYDVADFVDSEIPPENLTKVLTEQVHRATWEQFGGRGKADLEGGTLTITNATRVHEHLDRLLEKVRELGLQHGRNGSTFTFATALEYAGHSVYDRSALDAALHQPVSMEFIEATVGDVIRHVRESSGFFCHIPDSEIAKAVQGGEMRVTKTMRGLPLKSVLDESLSPFKLDWYATEYGSVNVITAEEAATRRDLWVIRVKELTESRRTADDLVKKITETIEPTSWQSAGGTAMIRTLPGLLLVRHNRRTQEQIVEFLDSRGNKP